MPRISHVSVPRVRTRAIFFLLAALVAFAACSDQEPGGVEPPKQEETVPLAALLCTGNTRTLQVICAPADANAGGLAGGGRLRSAARGGFWLGGSQMAQGDTSLIIGGQNINVTLTGSDVFYDSGTQEFRFNTTIKNLIVQPLGTTDGTTLHPWGVRVFFLQQPRATGGGGETYSVIGADTATFTQPNQVYYTFNEIIQHDQTSGPVLFKFGGIPDGITFTFTVLVWAPVQWPEGWVEVSPAVDTLNLADLSQQSITLTGTVRDGYGKPQAETITWGSSNTSVATVDASGVVTAVSAGSATITASAAGRVSGAAAITVIQPADLANSTLTTGASTLTADGTSTTTVTLQLKDALGNNLTHNAGTVAFTNSGAGTLPAPAYAGNGAYTSTLTAPTVIGFDTIAATFDTNPVPDTAVVEYTAGVPTALRVEANDSTANASTAVTITAQLIDANGNEVKSAGTSVAWGSTNGGSFGSASTSTDATGVATVQFTTSADGGTVHVISGDAGGGVTGNVTVSVINVAPVGGDDSYDGIGNVTINIPQVSGLLSNDASVDGGTFTAAAETVNTTQGGTAVIAADGSFTYRPKAGFTNGNDTFQYQLIDQAGAADTVTVTMAVSGIYWFVDAAASGTGTQFSPAATIPIAVDSAEVGDTILIKTGTYAGATLENSQVLLGSGTSAFQRTLNGQTIELLAVGARPVINSTVTLGSNNTIESIDINTSSGNGITGNFGTLRLRDMNISANGAALQLANGTLDAVLGTMSASGSGTHALLLTNVGGSLTATGGTLSGGSTATVQIDGNAASITYPGAINGGSGKLVHILNRTGGTLDFTGNLSTTTNGITISSNTGGTINFSGASKSITATTGAGVSMANNTGATVNFTGGGLAINTTGLDAFSATLGGNVSITGSNNNLAASGGRALNLSSVSIVGGTMTLGNVNSSGANSGVNISGVTGTITSTGGTVAGSSTAGAFLVTGGSTNVTWGGGITQANNQPLVSITGAHTGTVQFNGSLSASNGTGLQFNNADGGYTFGGTTTLNGGDAAIDIANGSSGTFNFGTGTSITHANAGTQAFFVDNSSPSVTYSGSIAKSSTGWMIDVFNQASGTITFQSGTLNATAGDGILSNNADGTINFNGTTTLNGGKARLVIGSLSGGAINVTSASITSPADTAISVQGGSASLTFNGNITQANNFPLLAVRNGHTGTLTFNSGTLTATNGTGLYFDNADGSYTFNGTTNLSNSVGGANAGVDIVNNSGGTFTFSTGTTINNPSGDALVVSSSAPSLTYSGQITKTNGGGSGINASSNTGGSINVGSGLKQINSGTSIAVNLANNSGMTFTSTNNLQITTTSGIGFNATGAGTVNVQGSQNTVSAGSGTAVNINNVTIGSNGVTWRSVSHSGGANGISLVNTGNSGGTFSVTGDGSTNGSGGSITNTTGGDGATAGNGIYLSNTRNISLQWMALSGHANNGLFGTGVRGSFTVNKVRFTGNNGSDATGNFDESPIQLVNHGGATRITNSRLDGGAYNALRIENITGTAPAIDSLVIENDTVATMQGSVVDVRGSAILVSISDGTADVRIRNNQVLFWWGMGIHSVIQGTASGTSRITGNFVDNTNGALAGAGGIAVAGGSHSFNISNNTIRHTNGTALSVDRVNFGATMQGTVDNNAIGVSGDPNSGTVVGAAIFAGHHGPGTTTVKISNNVIRQAQAGSGNGAIWLLTGDAAGFGGSGFFNATVSGNNIQESSAPLINAHNGILLTIGTQSGPPNDTDQSCFDIVSNTILNFNANTNRIRVNARFGTTSRFPGYTGAATGANSATDIGAYMQSRNTITQSNSANSSTSGFFNTSPPGSACPQPSM